MGSLMKIQYPTMIYSLVLKENSFNFQEVGNMNNSTRVPIGWSKKSVSKNKPCRGLRFPDEK